MGSNHEAAPSLILTTPGGLRRVAVSAVRYIEAKDGKHFVFTDKRDLLGLHNMVSLGEIVRFFPDELMQVHRSFVVGTRFIAGLNEARREVLLCTPGTADETRIPLGDSFAPAFRAWFLANGVDVNRKHG